MAPPPSPALLSPPEQAAESATATADAHRSLPTPFLTKTYQIVDDPAFDDVISWNDDGSTFVVWRPAEFARDLLPKYFKHNNFSSFVRQLNTYGFRKIVPDRWEFANDCFRRGEKQLLCDIHRRKVPPSSILTAIPVAIHANRMVTASPTSSGDEQVLSSSTSTIPLTSRRGSGSTPVELAEENSRLRKENERLNQELSQMKSMCDNILLLMSKYANQLHHRQQHEEVYTRDSGCSPEMEKPPELVPMARCAKGLEPADWVKTEESRSPRPRLFGVPIGSKRARAVEDGVAVTADDDEESPQHQRAVQVKPEPTDPRAPGSPSDKEHHRWRLFEPCRPNQRVCN